jgi:hypothetical protein
MRLLVAAGRADAKSAGAGSETAAAASTPASARALA